MLCGRLLHLDGHFACAAVLLYCYIPPPPPPKLHLGPLTLKLEGNSVNVKIMNRPLQFLVRGSGDLCARQLAFRVEGPEFETEPTNRSSGIPGPHRSTVGSKMGIPPRWMQPPNTVTGSQGWRHMSPQWKGVREVSLWLETVRKWINADIRCLNIAAAIGRTYRTDGECKKRIQNTGGRKRRLEDLDVDRRTMFIYLLFL